MSYDTQTTSDEEYSSSFEEEISGVEPLEDEQEKKRKKYTKNYQLHEIKISTTERFCKEVDPPNALVLTDEEFYGEEHKPNIDVIKEHLRKEGRVSVKQIHQLIDDVYELFCVEHNVLWVEAPLTVCGDVHGQYYDLLKLFEVGGDPKTTRYLFLGDYVDRGNFSIECLILLFSYKILYPTTFWMIRGNHECRHLTDYFTFKEECEFKYDLSVYDAIMETFDALPLAAIMNKQFLCVHGGLSPQLYSVDQLNEIDRFTEPPPNGLMCDLLWADPMEDFSLDELYEFNSVRGCSWNFGFAAVCNFLEQNKLLSVIRAHEAQDAGYRMYRRNEKTGFPSVITLFSAPNYLDSYNNKGAVLRYENNVINIRQFNHSPHPYYLPGFMNVFAWSLPFVAEKMGEILMTVLKLVNDVQIDEEEEVAKKREAIRSKMRGLGRMMLIFKTMREERENLMIAGQLSPNGVELPPTLKDEPVTNSSPQSLSSSGGDGLVRRNSLQSLSLSRSFEVVKNIDRPNEARPPSPRESPLRASDGGLQRRLSRDNSLQQRKNSMEKINVSELLRNATSVTPDIKEDKV